jgi:dihydrofolate reductase
MKKLVLQMQISVDGFVAGPNGELDWIFTTIDEATTNWIVERLWQADVHIMGRRTFQDMASYWPTSTEPYAAPMNEIPKVVFTEKGFTTSQKVEVTTAVRDASRAREERGEAPSSTRPASAESWNEATVVTGHLADEIAGLKQQAGKDILAHGGAGFAQALVSLGLIDEYRLIVHPVALGRGLPLFSRLSKPLDLELVSSTAFNSGSVAQVYSPA